MVSQRPNEKIGAKTLRVDPGLKAAAEREHRNFTSVLGAFDPQPMPLARTRHRTNREGIVSMTREKSITAKSTPLKRAPAKGLIAPVLNQHDGSIRFYRANEKPYGAFSNLYPRPIEFEDRVYPTAEHAYQAGKASKPAVREWILSAPTPSLAAMAAHGLYVWDVVPNWAQIKFDRMRAVLRAKFEQHADLKDLLLSTDDARLVEAGTVNNAVNRLWGEVDGKGKNTLGVMLMDLRSEYSKPKVKRASRSGTGSVRTRKKKPSTSKRPAATE